MAPVFFAIIVAVDTRFGIGKNGGLPWRLPGELKHFARITRTVNDPHKQNAVIMGRKTWESLPSKFSPLPGRINIVLTRDQKYSLPRGVYRAASLETATHALAREPLSHLVESVFVVGGAQVFREALRTDACREIFLTKIFEDFGCDTFMPDDLSCYQLISQSAPMVEDGVSYVFCRYVRGPAGGAS
jgi:dihydrofolate reductase/thymidylate synthase